MLNLKDFERRHQRLASWPRFRARFTRNVAIACMIVGVALGIGMAGYGYFEGMNGVDAFLNASMILSGMGPAATLETAPGKVFAGLYALASGLVVVLATGLILAPIFHRVLHHFHCDDGDHEG